MLQGETVQDSATKCMVCRTTLYIRVLKSAAGHYIGFFCSECGPHSRESGYYPTREAAQAALDGGLFGR